MHGLVQGVSGDLGVQPLELLAELGDILVCSLLGCGELGLQCGLLLRLPPIDCLPPIESDPREYYGHDDQ